jgi:hypothetical protein
MAAAENRAADPRVFAPTDGRPDHPAAAKPSPLAVERAAGGVFRRVVVHETKVDVPGLVPVDAS